MQKATELDADLHEAHFNLGLLYLQKEEKEKAKESIEKAISISPSENYEEVLEGIE